ncbi:MAG TPA: 6-phosphofructokinase [Bacillota bacterium]|nr:6-phosphofructokinase [Bacillota bacterium]HPF42555.1 6-phosphofructokinase [Bacillota bacterium]HPJ85887.1 6-phosphofructokinase [Bacillota bacterium]HPQ62177.1 6-phosphofructokinase [Bacillota bacterium]HRX91585.1 6-phosphofructokinase [Candidatus Izemoplasmatales bacterium]
MLKGNLLYGQSGGPTSVINASAYGVISEARKNPNIKDVIFMKHGIKGALNEDFFFLKDQDEETVELLKHTPGSAFGSVRYKLKDFREDDSNYLRLLYIFQKYNIRYFLYNGGNDSMDTCAKIADYMNHIDYDCYIIGIPKTIDNDLPHTDHTPGFGSAAKYIINTMMEISYDMLAYPNGKVTIVEIMGRHAGWLTASSALAQLSGFGPDLIYLPEVPFSVDKFLKDVKQVYNEKKQCLVAVSEGIMNEEGIFISSSSGLKDAFGHFQLGGVSSKLATTISADLGIPSRSVELGSTQRAASHIQSLTDVTEAIEVGKNAVRQAVAGVTGKMVTINRISSNPYEVEYGLFDLTECANTEKRVPLSMINSEGNGMNEELVEYIVPLINGENPPKYKNGIQQFSRFK